MKPETAETDPIFKLTVTNKNGTVNRPELLVANLRGDALLAQPAQTLHLQGGDYRLDYRIPQSSGP